MLFVFLKNYLFSSRAGALIRSISYMCMGGVAIAVAATIIVLSIMLGFNESLEKRTLSVEPHFQIDLGEGDTNSRAQEISASFQNEKEIRLFSVQNQDVILRTVDGSFQGASAVGMDREGFLYVLNKLHTKDTDDFQNGPEALGENEVAVGADLAQSLGIYEGDELVITAPESLLLPIGEKPTYEKVKVKRILLTQIPEIDANVIFYDPILTMQSFRKTASLRNSLDIHLEKFSLFDEIQNKLEKMQVPFESWKDKNKALLVSLKMEKYAMGGFLTLTVLIASFSILTVLALVISQKRKDIATLLTLGYTPKRVTQLFTQIGFSLSACGTLIGASLAIGFCTLLDRYSFLSMPAEIYYDNKVPVRMDLNFIAFIIFSSCTVAYFASWIPARFTSREEVVDLMRDRIGK